MLRQAIVASGSVDLMQWYIVNGYKIVKEDIVFSSILSLLLVGSHFPTQRLEAIKFLYGLSVLSEPRLLNTEMIATFPLAFWRFLGSIGVAIREDPQAISLANVARLRCYRTVEILKFLTDVCGFKDIPLPETRVQSGKRLRTMRIDVWNYLEEKRLAREKAIE